MPTWLRGALLAIALLVMMPLIGASNVYYLEVATQVGIFAALALGLNIVVGLAGLLDLGYVAFFAVGAYSWAIFGSPHANVIFGGGFPLAGVWFYAFLFVGLFVAAITGILLGLPVLRLHGDYLAIVTLGFGEVIRVLANNLDKPINLTNGPKGITPISRPPAPLGLPYGEYFYFLVLLIVVIVILVNRRLEDSHIGRASEAIREYEVAARAMGVPLVRMKLLAFACGASFAGIMGVLFSAKQIFINPESFTFLESIGVLAMVILGGDGLHSGRRARRHGRHRPQPPGAEGAVALAQRAQERRRHRPRLQPRRPADAVRAGQVRADDLRRHPGPHDDLPPPGHPAGPAAATRARSPGTVDGGPLRRPRGDQAVRRPHRAAGGGRRARVGHRVATTAEPRGEDGALPHLHGALYR